jgi:hypothetical protein
MNKIADIDAWLKVGGDAGWIGPPDRDDGLSPDEVKEAFIRRMESYGMTEEEIKRALLSGALERLQKTLGRLK